MHENSPYYILVIYLKPICQLQNAEMENPSQGVVAIYLLSYYFYWPISTYEKIMRYLFNKKGKKYGIQIDL